MQSVLIIFKQWARDAPSVAYTVVRVIPAAIAACAPVIHSLDVSASSATTTSSPAFLHQHHVSITSPPHLLAAAEDVRTKRFRKHVKYTMIL